MTPYFQNDRVTLYHSDNIALLERMSIGEFDAIVTDPPYGLGEAAGKNRTRGSTGPDGKARRCTGFGAGVPARDYGDTDWDDDPCPQSTIELMRKASRWQIIFGGNYFQLPPTRCWLVWDKRNEATDFAHCELAWTNLRKAVRKIEHLWNGMLRDGQEERFHPTQKPVRVMVWAIGHLPAEVETILDPFAGVGTTGVACLQCDKRCVLIEREEKYCEIAAKRLDKSSRFKFNETKYKKQLNTKLNAKIRQLNKRK